MSWWRKRENRIHCAHREIRAIYGDEIYMTPGRRRLRCLECDTALDGPPELARLRQETPPMPAPKPPKGGSGQSPPIGGGGVGHGDLCAHCNRDGRAGE